MSALLIAVLLTRAVFRLSLLQGIDGTPKDLYTPAIRLRRPNQSRIWRKTR